MAKDAAGKSKALNLRGFRRRKREAMAKGTTGKAEAMTRPLISAKDAVIAASRYFTEVTGITSGVSVEELELTEDGKNWIVTLGYLEYAGIVPIMQRRQDMIYKTFKVDARTGAVMSMKIREL